ncbi:ABC-three component system middle component 5 [Kiloniella sp.]|uniref:ABC-three component system middle component 5 n=1 Tax=Kiloniella sp. TaxID=1938587 RepID=UPI003A90B013
MFSLTYTSAYDPYHAVFRYIALLKASEEKYMAARTLRVADFFLCFPWKVEELRAPRGVAGFTKQRNLLLKRYQPTVYDVLPDPRVVFERMESMQLTAISAMLGAKLIKCEESGTEDTYLQESHVSKALANTVDGFIFEHNELFMFLTRYLTQISIFGDGGIFSRSGLGEYRYDII